MKKVEYICNLCRDRKYKEDLHSYVFIGSASLDPDREYTLDRDVELSDVHICLTCIQTIKTSEAE